MAFSDIVLDFSDVGRGIELVKGSVGSVYAPRLTDRTR